MSCSRLEYPDQHLDGRLEPFGIGMVNPTAASGAASIAGVAADGLPNITSFVSGRSRPTSRASPLWSMTANTSIRRAATTAERRATVSASDHGLTFVTTAASPLIKESLEMVSRSWIRRACVVSSQMTPLW